MSIYSAVLSDKDRGLRLAEKGSVDEGEGDWDADDIEDCEFDAEFVALR